VFARIPALYLGNIEQRYPIIGGERDRDSRVWHDRAS
jgi:hypothetical protein